jgi:crotonobetainyl-CoA:carnitine CoA-transferase CaiB-like acyl-CoA transferase
MTTSLAGPYCTLILGALGADVIKIERREVGDDTRNWGPPFWDEESAMFLSVNSNKRSLAVDLKKPAGVEAVLRVAEESAVFIESLRPGSADKLGLGFDEVADRRPGIVYCSISAFGNQGPRSQQPGYDPLMQAMGGIMSVTGEPGRRPVRAGISVVDQGTGLWATIALLSALRLQDTGAPAQYIETSLFEVALNWLPYQIVGHLATGEVPKPLGSALGILAPYQTFLANDGEIMIAAANDTLFAALCQALGLPSLAQDSRFRTNPDRVANREALVAVLNERIRLRSIAEWMELLQKAGVPVAPVQDIREVVNDEQTRALKLLQALEHPHVKGLRVVAPPLSINGKRVLHRTPPPDIGQHSADVLAEVGYTPDEVEALRRSGAVT